MIRAMRINSENISDVSNILNTDKNRSGGTGTLVRFIRVGKIIRLITG
jgi:hypothetical protein